jgi:hypothetical protein
MGCYLDVPWLMWLMFALGSGDQELLPSFECTTGLAFLYSWDLASWP